jgi:hypothetical protein
MVLKSVRGKGVSWINPKIALSPFYGEIAIYPQRQLVKEDVAIWAKAKDVFRDIGAIVGTTERFDMAGFRIRSCHCYEPGAADLTSKIVQSLHPFTHRCAAHQSSDC